MAGRISALAVFLIISATLLVAAENITTTGWLSDRSCPTARASSGIYSLTNPDCALKCISKGEKMVLIAEKEKAIYLIANPAAVRDHFAEPIKVKGTSGRCELHVDSITNLGDYQGSACSRPKSHK